MTKQEQFERLQAAWRKAHAREQEIKASLTARYGTWYVYAPLVKREKADRLADRANKASDAIFTWLDNNSPRQWRSGVPYHWVCDSLTYADAVTHGPLSVVPPVSYGGNHSLAVRFARALPTCQTSH